MSVVGMIAPDPVFSTAANAGRVRVLSVSHSAVRAGAARMRYEALANDPALEMTLVVPRVWHEAGKAEHAEPSKTGLNVTISPARLTRGGPAKWYLHHYPKLAQHIQTVRPDVIHLWEEPWSLVALQASRLRDRLAPNAALVLETDQNIHRRLPAGFEQIRRYTLARTDLLIARGEESLAVSRQCGFQGAYEFVEYGINTDTFYPRHVERPSHAGRPFRIGYVGRLVPEKGLDDVLAALAQCHASAVPIDFEMLGDGPEKAGLLRQIAALGLSERVRILEPRTPDGVAEFMSSLDALVLMSKTTRTWKEQFGRVIMEAHGCGVPVIGSSSGSIPKVVGDGGWIVPEGDVSALAATLMHLVGAPDEVALARAAGMDAVHRRFGFPVVSANLRSAWVRALSIRRGTSA